MATKLETKASELYEADFYVWAERQAELLRARRFKELDLSNLIEEVEDLGGALKRSVLNNTAVVLEHLLKLQHSPATEPRNGWRASVREHRRRLRIDLTPRLRQILDEDLASIYEMARQDAADAMLDHANTMPPMRCRRAAPAPSTRSRAIGCPDLKFPHGPERSVKLSGPCRTLPKS